MSRMADSPPNFRPNGGISAHPNSGQARRIDMRRRHNHGDLGMSLTGKLFCVALALVFTVFCAAALSSARSQPQSEAAKTQLERGRYLVQQVGICGDCHTPRDDKGQPVEE